MTEKVKQEYLNGMKPPSIKAIDRAAEAYYDLVAESFQLRGRCELAKDKLMDVMQKNELTIYGFEDKTVEVIDKKTVKVKKKMSDEG